MTRDRGVVLINALVIVLAMSAVAAALLTRSEAARTRTEHASGAHQLALYLDAGEVLVPDLLEATAETSLTHHGQAWATAGQSYPVDRGRVAIEIADLQGRLNVNWLRGEDDFVDEVFAQVFNELRLPRSLLAEIGEFVGNAGPRGVDAYMSRRPPLLPRGGPARTLDDLREVRGMTAEAFAALRPVLAALPPDARLNLNTAPEIVLRAVLEPFPPDVAEELLEREEPVESIGEVRRRVVEVLETEDVEHLPFDRLTVASNWFEAYLAAELDGAVQRRRTVYFVEPAADLPIRRLYRWAVYD